MPQVSGDASWTRSDILTAIGDIIGVIAIAAAFTIGLPIILQKTPGKPKLIKTYFCCPRHGKANKQKGELCQGAGESLTAADARTLGVTHDNGLWRWTHDPAKPHSGGAVIWGPYSFDCTQPGTYVARFRLKGERFQSSSDINSEALMEIDVNAIRYGNQTSLQRDYRGTSARLSTPAWVDIDLEFAIFSGQEELEYRISLYDGHSNEYPYRFGPHGDASILFDRVDIWRKRSVWDALCDRWFNPKHGEVPRD